MYFTYEYWNAPSFNVHVCMVITISTRSLEYVYVGAYTRFNRVKIYRFAVYMAIFVSNNLFVILHDNINIFCSLVKTLLN